MAWIELFAVLLVCHLVGDFIFQTNWQAINKHGGLGPDLVARRALISHIATYSLAFLPAFVWVSVDRGVGWAAATAALIAIPHLIQDDGRLIAIWARRIKGLHTPGGVALVALDQSFHALAIFATALVIA